MVTIEMTAEMKAEVKAFALSMAEDCDGIVPPSVRPSDGPLPPHTDGSPTFFFAISTIVSFRP